MAEVKELYVRLYGEVVGFNSKLAEAEMAAKKAESEIVSSTGRTHSGVKLNMEAAGKEFEGFRDHIKDVMSEVGGFLTGGMGLGAGLIGVGLFTESVKSAEEYNKALAGLAASAKDQGILVPKDAIDANAKAMLDLGAGDMDVVAAMRTLTEAHVPLTDQLNVMTAAQNLAAGTGMDLQSSLRAVLMGAQGSGRALKEYGLNLPEVIPTTKSLDSATQAVAKAQEHLNQVLADPKHTKKQAEDAANKLHDAQGKLTKVTDEYNNKLGGLDPTLAAIEQRFGGVAKAAENQDPLHKLGLEFQHIAITLGEDLLPYVDEFANWVETHQSEIEQGLATAFHDVGVAVHDVGQAFNDMRPYLTFAAEHWKEILAAVIAFKAVNFAGELFSIDNAVGKLALGSLKFFWKGITDSTDAMIAATTEGKAMTVAAEGEAVALDSVGASAIASTTEVATLGEATTATATETKAAGVAAEGAGLGFSAMLGPIGLIAGLALPELIKAFSDTGPPMSAAEANAEHWRAVTANDIDNVKQHWEDYAKAARMSADSGLSAASTSLSAHLEQSPFDATRMIAAFGSVQAAVDAANDSMKHMDASASAVVQSIGDNAPELKKFYDTWKADNYDTQRAIADLGRTGDSVFQQMRTSAADDTAQMWSRVLDAYGEGSAQAQAWVGSLDGSQHKVVDSLWNIRQASGKTLDQILQYGRDGTPVYVNINGVQHQLIGTTQQMIDQYNHLINQSPDLQKGVGGAMSVIANNTAWAAGVAQRLADNLNNVARAGSAAAAGGMTGGAGGHTFATGGKVTRPTFALVGEGGEEEWIIPKHKAAGHEAMLDAMVAGAMPSSVGALAASGAAPMPSGGLGGGGNVFILHVDQVDVHGVQDVQSLWDQLRKVGINRGRQQGTPTAFGKYA